MKKTVFRKILALIMVLSLIPCWGVSAWADEIGVNAVGTTETASSVNVTTTVDDTIVKGVVAENGGTATIEGDVSATNDAADPGNGSIADGVDVFEYSGSTSTVTVGGDVSASTNSETGGPADYANGVEAWADGIGSAAVVEVTGDVSAATTGTGDATGIYTDASFYSSVDVSAGDVTATSSGTGDASGVFAYVSDLDTHTEITVGDVTAETTASGYSTAEGIYVETTDDGSAEINAQSVSATANGDGIASGITATGADGGVATVTVAGKVDVETDNNLARGINATASAGAVTIQAGEVESESEHGGAWGVNLDSAGTGSTGTVNVSGPITVTGEEYAYGAMISAFNGGTAVLNVTAAEDTAEDDTMIKAESENGASGITIWTDNNGTVDVTVEGNIESDGIGIYSNTYGNSLVDVDVIGDITASEVGLVFNGDGKNSSVVDGTVHGDSVGIQLQDKITSDNLDITVWKIDPSKIGAEDHVVAEKNSGEWTSTATSKEVEANIHYIIKIEPSQENIFTLDGATEHQGYQYTAKQGENVAVRVNVPGGYQLTGAYGYDGGKLPLKIDPNTGDYYVIMPMGGGILLRAALTQIPTGGSGSYSSGDEYAYASYTGNVQYATITFDLNGGHTLTGNPGPVIRSVPVGTWLRLIDAPKKDGSAFELWHTDDETVKACNPFDSFCVMGDVDFIAKWAGEDLPYQPTEEDTLLVNSLVTTSLLPVTERSVEEPTPVDAADSETLNDDTPSVGDPVDVAVAVEEEPVPVDAEPAPEVDEAAEEDPAETSEAVAPDAVEPASSVAEEAPVAAEPASESSMMIEAMTTLTAATEALQAATEALIANTAPAAVEAEAATEAPAAEEAKTAEEAGVEDAADVEISAEAAEEEQPAVEETSSSMDAAREELQRITEELDAAKSELRATSAELDTAKGELKATTEELNAAKDELRATTGELVEAKDALRSAADELNAAREEFRLLLEELKAQVPAAEAEEGAESSPAADAAEEEASAENAETLKVDAAAESEPSAAEESGNS